MYNSKNLAEDILKHRGVSRKPTLEEKYPSVATLAKMAVDMGFENSRSLYSLMRPELNRSHMDSVLELRRETHYRDSLAYMASYMGIVKPEFKPIPIVIDTETTDWELKSEVTTIKPIITFNTEEFDKSIKSLQKAMANIEQKQHEVIVFDSLDFSENFHVKNTPTRSGCGCYNPNRTENHAGGEKFYVCAKSKGGCGKEIP